MARRILVFLLVALAPAAGYAGTRLDFDAVLRAALSRSYEIRTAFLDIGVSRSSLKEARSAYYPALSGRFNSQYTKDLTGGASTGQVTAIDQAVVVQNTYYQDAFSLSASMNLYDFGIREDRVLVAKKDVPLKKAVYVQSIREAKIKTLETYRDLQVALNDLASKRALLRLHKELALAEERLFAAGYVSKIEVSDEAIRVVKTLDDIDSLELKVASTLQDLSYLTGEHYEREGIEASPLGEQAGARPFDLSASPEFRIYELALEKKRAEISALRKSRLLPQFGLYSNYIMYGQDPSSYNRGFADFTQRNFYIGLVAVIPIFDGFKNEAQIEKTRLELEQIKVEREKKLSDLTTRYEKLQTESRILAKSLGNQQEILKRTEEGLAMTERLRAREIVDHADLLQKRIELVTQKQELARAGILKAAATRELQFVTEVQD